jgi:hypothetical protein
MHLPSAYDGAEPNETLANDRRHAAVSALKSLKQRGMSLMELSDKLRQYLLEAVTAGADRADVSDFAAATVFIRALDASTFSEAKTAFENGIRNGTVASELKIVDISTARDWVSRYIVTRIGPDGNYVSGPSEFVTAKILGMSKRGQANSTTSSRSPSKRSSRREGKNKQSRDSRDRSASRGRDRDGKRGKKKVSFFPPGLISDASGTDRDCSRREKAGGGEKSYPKDAKPPGPCGKDGCTVWDWRRNHDQHLRDA